MYEGIKPVAETQQHEEATVERIPLPDMKKKLEQFAQTELGLLQRDISNWNYEDVLRDIDRLAVKIKRRIDMIKDIEEGPLRSGRRYSDKQINQEF